MLETLWLRFAPQTLQHRGDGSSSHIARAMHAIAFVDHQARQIKGLIGHGNALCQTVEQHMGSLLMLEMTRPDLPGRSAFADFVDERRKAHRRRRPNPCSLVDYAQLVQPDIDRFRCVAKLGNTEQGVEFWQKSLQAAASSHGFEKVRGIGRHQTGSQKLPSLGGRQLLERVRPNRTAHRGQLCRRQGWRLTVGCRNCEFQ